MLVARDYSAFVQRPECDRAMLCMDEARSRGALGVNVVFSQILNGYLAHDGHFLHKVSETAKEIKDSSVRSGFKVDAESHRHRTKVPGNLQFVGVCRSHCSDASVDTSLRALQGRLTVRCAQNYIRGGA